MRRHHNTSGQRQIARGKTRRQVEYIARRLGVPFPKAPCPACGRLTAKRTTDGGFFPHGCPHGVYCQGVTGACPDCDDEASERERTAETELEAGARHLQG
jgi:ssDNA-binding Zn-finger/Zn-ribbon topoisomerase 1